MSGSVVCKEHASGGNSKKRKAAVAKPKSKAKAKAKARCQSSGGGGTEPELEPETDLQTTTVACQQGVRQKLWLDDLISCVNHAINGIRKIPLFSKVDDHHFNDLKKEMVRIGLIFAFKGQYLLPGIKGKSGKKYRKWSSLRPALQTFAVHQMVQAFCWANVEHNNNI